MILNTRMQFLLDFKKKFFLFLLFILGAQLIKSQEYFERKIICGRIYNSIDTLFIPYVHVINLSTGMGTVAGNNGIFYASVSPNDTLIFSVIGYERLYIKVSSIKKDADDFYKVFLLPKVYELPVVNIFRYRNFEEFKFVFAKTKITKEPELPVDLSIENPSFYLPTPQGGMGVIFSPITFLYETFSRRERAKREYLRLVAADEMKKKVELKYNAELVGFVTGMKDKDSIYCFMEFCNISDEFVLSNNTYEIIKEILSCWKRY